MRIGIGYDLHRMVELRPMVLGGVVIPFSKGLEGHSDADVLLHAICDAILGALGRGDIGQMFPDTDPKYKDISSKKLLKDVKDLMVSEGYKIGNLDCIVIAEEPRLGPYRDKIKNTIAEILEASPDNVNIKATTTEKTGAIGRSEAIAAHAAVLLEEKE
jgi:2-C-methyl-D-erythritol 2,4-cyclodiphosphate synthase